MESTTGNTRTRRRVFVVEDHPLMRRSIVATLAREPDLIVCGQAEDAGEALAAIARLQPDLVLTDVELKSSSGLALIEALRLPGSAAPTPLPAIVATSMFNVADNERRARAAGATGFVAKQSGPEALIAALRAALDAAA